MSKLQLYWSTRSPFVRKVMVVAHELGIAGEIETIREVVHPAVPNDAVMRHHPLSRIPVLVVDDRSAIFDSRVIMEYLDTTYGSGSRIPTADRRWTVLTRHALADSTLETALLWLTERARAFGPDEKILASCRKRINAALDVMARDDDLVAGGFDLSQIAVASTLFYLDFRFADLNWRHGRERLAAWLAQVAERPSIQATQHADIY